MLTDNELLEIIQRGESDRVEFTQSRNDSDKFRKAICAFANDLPDHREPGLIFVGVKDDGTCANLTIDDKLLQTLGGLRSDGKILPFPYMGFIQRFGMGIPMARRALAANDNPELQFEIEDTLILAEIGRRQ